MVHSKSSADSSASCGRRPNGFQPTENTDHIRKSELCATCHTLYTAGLGPGGKVIGELPEQVPYQEWLHSDYKTKQTCQSCHMPVVEEPVPITRVFGVPREDFSRHVFVAANFFMQRMLNMYRGDLEVPLYRRNCRLRQMEPSPICKRRLRVFQFPMSG